MPLYMDRHHGERFTSEGVAGAHSADLKVQDKYGCQFITYWLDEERDSVFCLVNAPHIAAVRKTHEEAHGFIPTEIIEVDPDMVRNFLGRVVDNPSRSCGINADSPFRAIMFTDLEGSTNKIVTLGDDKSMELLRVHNGLTRDALRAHGGQEIKHTGDGFMTSFASAVSAIECAIAIQRALVKYNEEHPTAIMKVRIGITAGEPVRDDKDLFGATVTLSARLCAHASPGSILVAQVVRDLCVGKMIAFIGPRELKAEGFDQPISLFEIGWS